MTSGQSAFAKNNSSANKELNGLNVRKKTVVVISLFKHMVKASTPLQPIDYARCCIFFIGDAKNEM